MVLTYHINDSESKKEIDLLNEMIEEFKKKDEDQKKELDLREGEILEKTDTIKKLSDEVEELKGVMFKLSDVRHVLNRVLEPYSSE